MDWKLVFQLSLFGLAMGIATVFVIPSNIEPWFWLLIFGVCAFFIARERSSLHFLHGLLVGVVNSVWVTSAHITFFDQYTANHPNLLFYDFGDSGHRCIGRKSSFYLANQGWEIVRCDVVSISKHGIQADTPNRDTVLNKNYFLGFSR
jgi:hypothetical protein